MLKKTAEAFKLYLEGDWSMSGVAECFPLLVKHLSALSDSQSCEGLKKCDSIGLAEIDLAGINALDACGCQLLSLFVRDLGQCGLTPIITNIPETFRKKIHLLGFDREFNLSNYGARNSS